MYTHTHARTTALTSTKSYHATPGIHHTALRHTTPCFAYFMATGRFSFMESLHGNTQTPTRSHRAAD